MVESRVLVNVRLSTWAEVLSGIHQGSVLGPIMFVIFINYLPKLATSTGKIFADDTKLFRNITLEEARYNIQTNLDMLVKWLEDWQLGFNERKCKVLHLGFRNPKQYYHMKGVTLAVATEEKDLCVIIYEELRFHKHVAAAVKKSSMMLVLIRATFTCLDEVTVCRAIQHTGQAPP